MIPVSVKTCPECGVSLEGLSPSKHAASHWGGRIPSAEISPEANRRYKLLVGGD